MAAEQVPRASASAQMSKTVIAVRHFGLGHPKSLKTAVRAKCFDGLFNNSRLLKSQQCVPNFLNAT